MSEFAIKVCNFMGSPVFDMRTSGQDISAIETKVEHGMYGEKLVWIFETKNSNDLTFMIRNQRGDVEIELPENWDIDTNVVGYNDFNQRLPVVTVARGDKRMLLGYIATASLKVHFFREPEVMGDCMQVSASQ